MKKKSNKTRNFKIRTGNCDVVLKKVSKGKKIIHVFHSFIQVLKIMVLERNLYYNLKDLKKGKILPKHSNCGYILISHNRGAVQKFMQIRSCFL